MSILEDAAKLRKYTVAELAAEAKRLGLKTGDDSVRMIREDRDAR